MAEPDMDVLEGIPELPAVKQSAPPAVACDGDKEKMFAGWAAKKGTEAVDGNRNNTVFAIAAEGKGRNLPESFVMDICMQYANGLSEGEVRDAVESAYGKERKANLPAPKARAQSSNRLDVSEPTGEHDLTALIEDTRDLLDAPPPEPAQLIKGIAYAGSKMTLSSNSKGKKTWLQMHLAACVATGRQWLVHEVVQGRVLYINLELQKWSFNKRLAALERAIGVSIPRGYLDALHLRGKRVRVEQLANMRLEAGRYSLICCDPLYKLHGGRSENDASEMADLLWCLETMASNAGAALLIAHHFAKGNAGSKNAIDRASGSGVLARDGDSILVMTEHEEPDAITLECILRDFPPVEPRALRWDFPVFVPDNTLEPGKHAQAGRPKKWNMDDVRDGCNGTSYGECVKALMDATKISKRTAEGAISKAVESGIVQNLHGVYSGVKK